MDGRAESPEPRAQSRNPAPTAADRVMSIRAMKVMESGILADEPEKVVQQLAALFRDHREAAVMFAGASFANAQKQVDQGVADAAMALLIHLHASVGHAVPAQFNVPTKPLPELLNDLEDALCLRVVPAGRPNTQQGGTTNGHE